jgi:hypothetical protein
MTTAKKYTFVAIGAAHQAKGVLYRFQPSRNGQSPSWDGRGGTVATHTMATPITDRSYWESRYVMTELTLETQTGDRLTINDAVVTLQRQKTIVSTAMVGMNGTVKEYINDGDYSISINVGIVAMRDGQIVDEYPADGIRDLRRILDSNDTINVYSIFLDLFDITGMVIKGYSIKQETHSNYQSVSITALSDEEVEVYSTDY